MSTRPAITSPHFEGRIGATIPAGDFPRANVLMDDSRYDYEGNWAFCRFDSDELLAARFGFGRGPFDGRDYGGAKPPSPSWNLCHIELVARDGAILWLGDGRYDGRDVASAKDRMDLRLSGDGREIFHIEGWPRMKWKMASHDGELTVDLDLALDTATVLPDCVMPSNRFAMWLATGTISCRARFGARSLEARGTVFLDHPRTTLEKNAVPPFGCYLYTPLRVEDGSKLVGYWCLDGNGDMVRDYSFGLWLDPEGKSTWLSCQNLEELAFDEDRHPCRWRQRWEGPGIEIEVDSRVLPSPILKVWGGPEIPKTRRDNMVFPLVFDSNLVIRQGGSERRARGGGFAEFVIHPAFVEGLKRHPSVAPRP